MKQILCNQCAGKVRLKISRMELVRTETGMKSELCGVCRKRRYCGEYMLVRKEASSITEVE